MLQQSLFDALLSLISSSIKALQHELEKAGLPEPWLDRPQLHPWDIDTPSKGYWDARRTLLSSLGTMTALVQNPRERILCEGMGYHHPAVQNFIAHTRIADILSGPDVDETTGLHVTEIARRINTHPAKLERILRFLCMYHIFQETSPNVFANNRCSACFKTGSPNADVPFYWSDISFRAATAFSRNLRNPETAFSERVQDSAFSTVFGSIKPEYDFDENDTKEIGDSELALGCHLDNLNHPGHKPEHALSEGKWCNKVESDFEHISNYVALSSPAASLPMDLRDLGPQVLSDSGGDDSSEQFSPLSELTGFRLTFEPSIVPESVTTASFVDGSSHLNILTESDSTFHEVKFFDHNATNTRENSLTDSDYLPNGVTDGGIELPVGSGTGIVAQRGCSGPVQEIDKFNLVDYVTTKQEELDVKDITIPPTTIISKKEPDKPSSDGEITTAFSFLSYPQCGLYRRAFAQGMFTLEIMNGALGYRDIDWKQWDKEDSVFVELGASTGHLSLSVLPCLDNARFINQDLPEVCHEGIKFFLKNNPEALQSGRVTFQPHDFFTTQPVKGAAVYILSNILHDWPDKEALNILSNIAKAMTTESRLLICEIVHTPAISQSLEPPILRGSSFSEEKTNDDACYKKDFSFNDAPWPLLKDYGIVNRYSHHQTIELMVLFNGLDRTLTEYCELFHQRGLELVKIHPIRKLVSVMELKLRDA